MNFNSKTDTSYKQLEALLEEADAYISAEKFSFAYETSLHVTRLLETIEVHSPISPDGLTRDFSIVIVAHQKNDGQTALRDMLLKLDPSRFELIFVENSSTPIFELIDAVKEHNVRLIRVGFNAGIGVARNLAIRTATGRGIIMIDDDGMTSEASIEALLTTFDEHAAVSVRGRVVPSMNPEGAPPHYDCGNFRFQRYCDIEGFSVWRTSELRRIGLFDPILYGHEGAELTARLYPHAGPDAFIYEPNAILTHDFALDSEAATIKRQRYEKLTKYCTEKNKSYRDILTAFRKMPNDPVAQATLQMRRRFTCAPAGIGRASEPVSIISTCYNGAGFLKDYARSLNSQTDQLFEVIFVDDGSEDNSLELIDQHLSKNLPRKLVSAEHVGRAGALNRALDESTNDICVIADVDDIFIPQRIEWTRAAYDIFPEADMIGLMIFDKVSSARASRPIPCTPAPLQVRKHFGMPAPFPGFSFRKSATSERFDPEMRAGIDCDWMFRALRNDNCNGYLLPLNATFYRTHGGQISTHKRDLQRSVALKHVRNNHVALIGNNQVDDEAMELLIGWTPILSGPDYWKAHGYAMRLADAAHQQANDLKMQQFLLELLRHVEMLHTMLLKRDYGKLKKIIKQRDDTVSAHDRREAQQEHRISELTRRMHEQSFKAETARAEIEKIFASRSWRATEPVRRVASIIRRQKK